MSGDLPKPDTDHVLRSVLSSLIDETTVPIIRDAASRAVGLGAPTLLVDALLPFLREAYELLSGDKPVVVETERVVIDDQRTTP